MRRALLLLALAASSLVLVVAPSATADDSMCVATLTGTHDNVVVPPGATCVLTAATVRGNVIALADSKLAVSSSTVQGNVEGRRADSVVVANSTVRQNVTIFEGGPAALPVIGPFSCTVAANVCEAAVLGSTIGGNVHISKVVGSIRVGSILIPALGAPFPNGNVQVEDNIVPTGDDLVIAFNTVAQNIQVYKNTGPGNKTVTSNNAVAIQCFENVLPFVGGPNGTGKKEGQCF
jgi:hypothetical protein